VLSSSATGSTAGIAIGGLELRSAPMVKMVRRNGTIPRSSLPPTWEEFHVLRRALCLCARPSEERISRNRGALAAVRVPEFSVSDFVPFSSSDSTKLPRYCPCYFPSWSWVRTCKVKTYFCSRKNVNRDHPAGVPSTTSTILIVCGGK
jgi:hypothetical protein